MQDFDITFALPQDVLFILDTLHSAGYEAYIVGGCVRDMILCELHNTYKPPNDYDIATSALPNDVMRLFPHSIPTGVKYGTISVIIETAPYEITTFRLDGAYSNARKPDSVRFTTSISEDIKRRDFSMNALAYAPHTGLIDEVGGVEDIINKRIVCVGEAKVRFSEDSLRILRALRFSATLGFSIESHTQEAIYTNAPLLLSVARERVCIEIDKLLSGMYVECVLSAFLPIIRVVIPQLPIQCDFRVFKALRDATQYVRWACFLYPCKTYAREILESLKFDNKSKERILTLLEYYDMPLCVGEVELRHIVVNLGGRERAQSIFEDIVHIKEAHIKARIQKAEAQNLKAFHCTLQNVLGQSIPLSLKELCINGEDLKHLGIKEGKQIGATLAYLLNQVLEEKLPHTREDLLQAACDKLQEIK
ncbi:CCA tRNA nucleotidyltransferase [Helicobacter japonicus]|uniref:CCA tRNA nucleotidyltransferase n=1 Tax=Helicobacter japonicus TaxID=425400 RepID=UPI0023F34325|nr:[cytidine(C)-cytidine(C)-adenosine (A)]-adding enzyme [Helicobacter japonicus]